MGRVNYRWDDSELRVLLSNLKGAKKDYRVLANEVLEELKQDVSYATHRDTSAPNPHMQDMWETQPLKMKDSGYRVMGALTNDSTKSWQKESYASYEIARGGDHDAIAQGLELLEMRYNDTLENVLEGLLKK